MRYTKGQQVEVWNDQNNIHSRGTYVNPIQNWQWTPAMFIRYDNNPLKVRCLVAYPPYDKFFVNNRSCVDGGWGDLSHTNSWGNSCWEHRTHKFDIVNVRPIEADAAAGFGV